MRLFPVIASSALALSLAAAAAGVSDQNERFANWNAPAYFAPPAAEAAHASAGRQALVAAPTSTPLPFVAVPPCRLVDTRGNGAPLTGGFLPAATVRNYTLVGNCGIPADAKAISLNATVVSPVGPGFLTLYPQGGAFPSVSTVNFVANETVANAAVVPLSATGTISVAFGVSGGDIVLDTNGYYSPLGVVNSLNGLSGNVSLVAGANITFTPGSGTLSISAANGTGPQGPAGPQGPSGPQGPIGTPGTFDTSCAIGSSDWNQFRDCLLAPALVYDSLPSPAQPNVPSVGYQATQTAEFGDSITLAGTARKGVSATVMMSDWAKHSDYPAMSAAGFTHTITLNLYSDAPHAAAHTPNIGTITQSFLIPWRPESDPTCPGGTGWRAGNGSCYSGYAFPIVFNLGGIVLPNTFIFGVAYDTNTWGYTPMGASGPYESLNVGLNNVSPVAVGTDNDPNGVYWNTKTPANYADGGAGGVGTFRADTNWAPFVPAVRFRAVN